MNFQRWRKLGGSDPAMYEMLQKIKALQHRLIGKVEEAVEKDLHLQEKVKLCLELRQALLKKPGFEASQEVGAYQSYLKDITKHMKAIAGELNMHHAQIGDYKDEIERSQHEVQDCKRKYFDAKRRNQLFRDAQTGTKALVA